MIVSVVQISGLAAGPRKVHARIHIRNGRISLIRFGGGNRYLQLQIVAKLHISLNDQFWRSQTHVNRRGVDQVTQLVIILPSKKVPPLAGQKSPIIFG